MSADLFRTSVPLGDLSAIKGALVIVHEGQGFVDVVQRIRVNPRAVAQLIAGRVLVPATDPPPSTEELRQLEQQVGNGGRARAARRAAWPRLV
jgi:hypothetical protein